MAIDTTHKDQQLTMIRPVEGPHSKRFVEKSKPITKWKWMAKLTTSSFIRREMAWLYNEYKRGFVLRDPTGKEVGLRPIVPEDLRVMTMLLGRINDVLRDAMTEDRLRELEKLFEKLDSGQELTEADKKRIVGSKALQDEPDDPEGDLDDTPLDSNTSE